MNPNRACEGVSPALRRETIYLCTGVRLTVTVDLLRHDALKSLWNDSMLQDLVLTVVKILRISLIPQEQLTVSKMYSAMMNVEIKLFQGIVGSSNRSSTCYSRASVTIDRGGKVQRGARLR
jgi:hypothetical protein